jgi:SAM-dependent methyltransferase
MAGSEVDGLQVGDAGYTHRIFTGGNALTRWSHRRRSRAALAVLRGRHFGRVADVGGADGWFLRDLVDAGITDGGVTIDIDPALLDAGRQASTSYPTLDFVLSEPDALAARQGRFELVACLETLEHVDDPAAVVDTVVSLARPGGAVQVSVPVEVGPAVLVKQFGRWLANRRSDYGYDRYPGRDLVRAGVLWRTDGIERANLHSHKGFDYRRIRALLADRVTIERTQWSPVRFLGPVAASTVTWLGRTPSS